MANTKQHPALGKMPKPKGGSRALDGPGVGSIPGGVDNTRVGETGATSHAGGKAHKSMGGGEGKKSKDPGMVSYNTIGGKPVKVKG